MNLNCALNMSPLTAWVYLVLSSGVVSPRVLAAVAGVSTRTIRRAIQNLREAGIDIRRSGQTSVIKPDTEIVRSSSNPLPVNNIDTPESGHETGQDNDIKADELAAIIPADMLLHIPARPELDELLSDPAQDVGTSPEHGIPPYNRGIP